MLIVIAKAAVKEGLSDRFAAAGTKVVNETRKEEGNISYQLLTDICNKQQFTFVEKWKSKEVLDLHMQTEHFKTFAENIKNLLAEELKIDIYQAENLS